MNALLSDLIIPPSLVLTLRDTEPAQNPQLWLQAIAELEDKMVAVKSRGVKVKAARELEGIIEALALKAIHQLPPFLLTLIRPLRSASKGLSTNLAVMQTSLLLKYQPFYAFLLRQSPRHAKQVERGYVNAARAYYETGLRRYARALGQIRLRTPDKPDLIAVPSSEEVAAAGAAGGKTPPGVKAAYERLRFADLDVEGQAGAVILAYQADDKEMVSVESGLTLTCRLRPSKHCSAPSASCFSTTRQPNSPSLCGSSPAQGSVSQLHHHGRWRCQARAHRWSRRLCVPCRRRGGRAWAGHGARVSRRQTPPRASRTPNVSGPRCLGRRSSRAHPSSMA